MAAQIADRWAEGRVLLRAADPRIAALVDALGERFRPWRTLAAVYLLTEPRVPAAPAVSVVEAL